MSKSLAFILLAAASTFQIVAKDVSIVTPPPFHYATLSPDGSAVAAAFEGGNDNRHILIVETANGKSRKVSVSDGKGGQARVEGLLWVSPDHLAITAQGDRDTTRLHIYQKSKGTEVITREHSMSLLRRLPGTTRFLAIEVKERDGVNACRLLEFDAATNGDPIERLAAQTNTFECVTDSSGRLRLLKRDNESGGDTAWYSVNPETGEQKRLNKIYQWVKVRGIVGDTSKAIVSGHIGTQYPAIYTYDFEKDQIEQTLAENADYSFDTYANAVFSPESGEVLGLHLDLLNRSTIWKDPQFAKLQDEIDAELVGSSNRILSWSDDRRHLLVNRFIPNMPEQTLHFDAQEKKFTAILLNGPRLKPNQISNTRLVRFPNRDGVELTAVLTVPQTKKGDKFPLLVWVRDGIWSGLDRPEWHPQANYFAEDGWVVLRINYTGSEGLLGQVASNQDSKGKVMKLFHDIEDGIKTLVDAGLVDPQKVCIGGEKAAAWVAAYAPIASPNTYKGVAAFNGLYDLVEYREASRGPSNDMNAGNTLGFAQPHSKLSDDDIRALSIPQNISNGYAKSVFVTLGKWSSGEYKSHVSNFQRALKKARVSVKSFSDDWWGSSFEIQAQLSAYDRAASALEAAVK